MKTILSTFWRKDLGLILHFRLELLGGGRGINGLRRGLSTSSTLAAKWTHVVFDVGSTQTDSGHEPLVLVAPPSESNAELSN